MKKEQMDQLLVKAVKKYELGVTPKILEKVPQKSEFEELEIEDISFLIVRDNLIALGKILDENENKKMFTACINSGVANSNPCILVVLTAKNRVYIGAFAREGLINQHSAHKAIQKLSTELKKYK